MAVDSGRRFLHPTTVGTAGGGNGGMSPIRGKDPWETRLRRRLWWHANRDWLQIVLWTVAVAGAALLLAHAPLG